MSGDRLLLTILLLNCYLRASHAADDSIQDVAAIRNSISRSIPLLERGAKGSLEQRKQCFNCHNQGLPVMALKLAQSRGFEVDEDHLRQQMDFTANFLARNRERYLEGRGQGGQVDTAGYALWMLERTGWASDATTYAVTEFFLLRQRELDYWRPDADRPPSEQSLFTSTFVAARGLKAFGTTEQSDRIQARLNQIKSWAVRTPATSTEDHVFRLRLLSLTDFGSDAQQESLKQLLQLQRADGGWGQLPEMPSDAYATATALVALQDAGKLPVDDSQYQMGIRFLISLQQPDGSWHVVSRATPIQSHFESGYPHGKDQFISIAAASWSTMALTLALPVSSTVPVNDAPTRFPQ